MAEYIIQEETLTGIADAIREKIGGTAPVAVSDMAVKIAEIEAGGGATEPYIEEVYNIYGSLNDVTLHGYTTIRDYMFYECDQLSITSLPSTITSIGNYAFYYCSNLALASLPPRLTSIGDYAFYRCEHNLKLTSLPSTITSIGNAAFAKCSALISITFEGTPTTIQNSAFKNCVNLTTINVPWAEGEVANAPWGATNATINYNYTGE